MHQTVYKFHIRLVALVVALLLLIPMAPAARAVSGDCGDGVTWELTGGVLTISGKGAMADYKEFAPAPWAEYGAEVRSVVVENGVTKVGNFAFFAMENLTAVTLADSVTAVGSYGFYGCSALSLLDLGNGVQVLGESAFERCKSLTAVRLPNSLQTLRFHAFYRCESLQAITVPSSVTEMESTVFGYCTSLQSASVMANIAQLPVWTFYGCENLRSVTLSPSITKTGVEAFEGCIANPQPSYNAAPQNKVEHSSTKTDENGVTTEQEFVGTPNSSVTTQTTDDKTTVDAVVENPEGWGEVAQQAGKADGDVQVNIHLKGETEVTAEQLGNFAGKDVSLTIHTQQGALWHINAADLNKSELRKNYDFSYTLKPLTDRSDAQENAVGIGDAFTVVFHGYLDFQVRVELPLGKQFAGSAAVFFAPEGKSYSRIQDVLVDNGGSAYFYLGRVQADTEYLIGINVVNPESDGLSSAIVPDSMQEQYGNPEQVEQIEYVVLGPKSSWGLDFGQVTWILVAVMVGSVIVVGVVVGILNKRRMKKGYIPGSDYDDEDE